MPASTFPPGYLMTSSPSETAVSTAGTINGAFVIVIPAAGGVIVVIGGRCTPHPMFAPYIPCRTSKQDRRPLQTTCTTLRPHITINLTIYLEGEGFAALRGVDRTGGCSLDHGSKCG